MTHLLAILLLQPRVPAVNIGEWVLLQFATLGVIAGIFYFGFSVGRAWDRKANGIKNKEADSDDTI